VTATGFPAPTFSDPGNLDGLTLNSTTGVLSGTPTTTGTFTSTITATNSAGTASQTFALTVGTVPVIAATGGYALVQGTAPSYTVTASGSPAPTFSDPGDLDGLSIDPNSGALSGTPTTTGSFTSTVTATNQFGSASQTFTLTVNTAPVIAPTGSYTLDLGSPAAYTVTASGSPAPTFSDPGNLDGLVLDATTGVLSGTPTTTGSFTSTITATNTFGSSSQSFTLTVDAAPQFVSSNMYTFTKGTAPSFTVTASGYPSVTYSDAGNLDGLVLDATTGVLSGTPTATGTFTSTITATNTVGSTPESFTLTVLGFHISTPSVLPSVGPGSSDPVVFATAGAGVGATFKWKGSAFPKGLKLSPSGTLTGTVSSKVHAHTVYHPVVTVTETVRTKVGTKTTKTTSTTSSTFTLIVD